MKKKLIQNSSAIILIDQAIFSGTSFLSTLLIARSLNIEVFGIFSGIVLGIYLLISVLNSFVIQPLQVKITTIKNQQSYLTFSYWLQLLLSVVITIGSILIVQLFINQKITLICFPFVIGFVLHDFARKALIAINKPFQALILDLINSFTQLISVYLFSSLPGNSLNQLLGILGIAYLPVTIISIYFINPFHVKLKIYYAYLRYHYIQGKWLLLTALIQWWAGNMYVVASAIYIDLKALGVLRLTQSLFGIINVLLQSFENYVLPQTAKRMTTSKDNAVFYLVNISKKTGIAYLVLLLFIYIFSADLIAILTGNSYKEYAYVVNWMIVLYIFIYLSQPLRIAIRAMKLNQYFFYGYLISLGISLIISEFLLSNFGLNGALFGLISSQIILIAFWQIVLTKKQMYLWKSFT